MTLVRSALAAQTAPQTADEKEVVAYGFQKAGDGSAEASNFVNPANLKFFAEHEKEIEALQKEFEALGRKK